MRKSKTIWGFPFYQTKKMPKNCWALVNENGDWVGFIENKILTRKQFIEKYKTIPTKIGEITP